MTSLNRKKASRFLERVVHAMFELETVLAFGVGAGLVALAPMVKRFGNPQLGDSMNQTGRSMAKSGIKLGVTVASAAGAAAKGVARGAAEAAEGLGDLVAEAKHEMESSVGTEEPAVKSSKSKKVTEVTVE
ncbi:hypothetical protein [Synechococcus sp. PROS-7-1]|uniref:hypothetical protein n=1 Tax=Synechococcus sp. PROS-7-1 TaxID=1442556 RepID=UPI0021056A8D|nr:hypothetical protein [Synechococcus sp. PROS-7-1]